MTAEKILSLIILSPDYHVDIERGLLYSFNANKARRPLGSKTKKGYVRAHLWLDGKLNGVMVHRVICIAAHGLPPSPLHLVNHKSGVKTENAASNLEWATSGENTRHAAELGLLGGARGERCHTAKITNRQARRIQQQYAKALAGRRRAPRGFMVRITETYGISDQAAWRIATGRSYAP